MQLKLGLVIAVQGGFITAKQATRIQERVRERMLNIIDKRGIRTETYPGSLSTAAFEALLQS